MTHHWVPNRSPSNSRSSTSVRARDRDNFGTVVEDQGSSASVHFISDDGKEATVSLPKSQLVALDGQPIVEPTSPLQLELINSADFAATTYRQRFLVKHVFVEGLPTICGGRERHENDHQRRFGCLPWFRNAFS